MCMQVWDHDVDDISHHLYRGVLDQTAAAAALAATQKGTDAARQDAARRLDALGIAHFGEAATAALRKDEYDELLERV